MVQRLCVNVCVSVNSREACHVEQSHVSELLESHTTAQYPQSLTALLLDMKADKVCWYITKVSLYLNLSFLTPSPYLHCRQRLVANASIL